MKRKKIRSKSSPKKNSNVLRDVLSLYSKLAEFKKDLNHVKDGSTEMDARLTDLEIHINLLTRLLTTLCIEKFGMRALTLKRLVRRIEKEAFRDSQIMELESLYRLSHGSPRKTSQTPAKPKDDPWEQIS